VVAHRDEQIKEQLATHLHLHLHGAATLERFPASDNECEVMSAKARVRVRRVVVRIPGRPKDGRHLDSTLEALLF